MIDGTDGEWSGWGPDPNFVLKSQAHILDNNQPPFFRRWTMRDLLAQASRPFEWTVKGLLPSPSYGPIGGEKKSLKSYIGMFIAVGLASGKPVFDRFTVPEPRPVVMYVGEGGSRLFARRLKRIANAMGVELDNVPLIPTFDTAPILDSRFIASLARDLEELTPGLVWLDPLYAYQGASVKGSDLYDRGAMLSSASSPCMEANASLLIGDHFNKNGGGDGLNRLTQAGMGEWADSWILVVKQAGCVVELGHFELRLTVGSRQTSERLWDLTLDIGRFDPDRGEHVGDISWSIVPATDSARRVDRRSEIRELLAERPWLLTKQQVLDTIKGNSDSAEAAFEALVTAGEIASARIKRPEGKRKVARDLWGPSNEPRPGPDSNGSGS